MSNELSPKCPQCGTPLPADAPKGLCPQCLMALNLKTETVFTDDTPAVQAPLPPERIAPHFPQLEILECLGRGGMGVVYKARQKTLNRFVALKLLAPERVNDTKFAGRFTREAQALAALNHPSIVTIYDFGQAGGFYYLLMEFVDGLNLRQLLRTRKFTPEEALTIVPPLCEALQFAHDRGIVHRDIKPENLLLDRTGKVKVADFGIARMLGTVNGNVNAGETAAPENVTQSIVGTPAYGAPEQKTDPRRVDSRADIYSLGVVFYELLTGELPGKRIEPPSRKVQIDVRLDEIVLRALEKKPELRYQQVSEVKTLVETIVATPPGGDRREEAQTESERQKHSALATPKGSFPFDRIAKWGSFGLGILIFGWFAFGAFFQLAHRLYSATAIVAVEIPAADAIPPGKYVSAGLEVIIKSPEVLDIVISNLTLKASFASEYDFAAISMDEVRRKLSSHTFLSRIPHTDSYQLTVAGNDPGETVHIADQIVRRLVAITRVNALPDGRVVTITEFATLNKDHTKADVVMNLILGLILGGGIGRIIYGLWVIVAKVFGKFLAASGTDVSPAESDNRPGLTGPAKSSNWRSMPGGLARFPPELWEIHGHMTAREKWRFGTAAAAFGLWNAATFFMPTACVWFFPIPVPLNWIISSVVLLAGLAFYPLWWRKMAALLCDTAWAKERNCNPATLRFFPFGSTGLMLLASGSLLIQAAIWWQIYEPAGVWLPYLSPRSIPASDGEWLFRITDVAQHKRIVLVRIACKPALAQYRLLATDSGPGYELRQADTNGLPNLDCLMAPDADNSVGKALAGSNGFSGKSEYLVGFVLPDDQAASKAVGQVRQYYLAKSNGLTKGHSDLPLFSLRRRLGNDAHGKPVYEQVWCSFMLAANLYGKVEAEINQRFYPADPSEHHGGVGMAVAKNASHAESPKLQFLAWQDEWKTNSPGAVRHPDGSLVTNAMELKWLKAVPPGGITDVIRWPQSPAPRFLKLWFSHPALGANSLNEMTVLDTTLLDGSGEIIPFGAGGNMFGRGLGANENDGQLGWWVTTFSPDMGARQLSQLTIRMRYTVGPLEHTQAVEVVPKQSMNMTLEGNGQLNGIGQNIDGHAFVSLAYAPAKMKLRQFGVVAVTKDGRELRSGSGGRSDSGVRVEEFTFDLQLADVAKFIIGTRPVRTNEWKNVVLPKADRSLALQKARTGEP